MGDIDWLDAMLRIMIVIGLGYGAYTSYARARASGTWSTRAQMLIALMVLVYAVLGVFLVAGYGLTMAPAHMLLFVLIAVLYFAGGIYLIGQAAGWLQARFAPERRSNGSAAEGGE